MQMDGSNEVALVLFATDGLTSNFLDPSGGRSHSEAIMSFQVGLVESRVSEGDATSSEMLI